MSEISLLEATTNLIKNYDFSIYQRNKCIRFFSSLKKDDYLYPGHFKSKLAIDIKLAYRFLEELKALGYLTNLYEVYCLDCNKSKGKFLNSLTEFEDEWYCDFCNKKLSINENIIVLYKVLKI